MVFHQFILTESKAKLAYSRSSFNKGHAIFEVEKIVSNLVNLFPEESISEEILLIKSSKLVIIQKDIHFMRGSQNSYTLEFQVPSHLYHELKPHHSHIQQHLLKKANVIFDWYDDCNVLDVTLIPVE